MKANIFYSWQSDLPPNRRFLEKCINKGINRLNQERGLLAILDRDTKNEFGSPSITDTVFRKIDRCKFFICDISLIGETNRHPNDNVLIELGYAIKVLGWDKIICLFDSKTGNVEELPFDINHNRITVFNSNNEGEIKFEQTVNYSTFLVELHNYSAEELSELITKTETLGFYYRFDYEEYQVRLETILDKLLSCDYFINSWREAVINFIDWIDMWTHSIEEHFSPGLLIEVASTEYCIKNLNTVNSANPHKSVILMKHIEKDKFCAVQGGFLSNSSQADKKVVINKKYALLIATRIKELLHNIDFWMNESGNEFVLDPKYYVIS